MRVSQYYHLGRTQPTLDFVDVAVDGDTSVFVDPTAIRTLASEWGQDCVALLQSYFDAVLASVKKGDDELALALLAALREPNDARLGLSSGEPDGSGIAEGLAKDILSELKESEAVKSGLLEDLEDTALMIYGIGPDRISDMTINILRGPLLKYTQDMCTYYDIPFEAEVNSDRIWDPQAGRWTSRLVPRPIVHNLPLLLIPKVLVRARVAYEIDEYYRHYLLTYLQSEELNANTSLVYTLKDGRKRVYKTDLSEKYGTGKLASVDITKKHPAILESYRQAKRYESGPPLDHEDLSEAEGRPHEAPDWPALLNAVISLASGKAASSQYEDAIEALLSALFYPELAAPEKQVEIHQGRKRIDLTYDNIARRGFFSWVAQHYLAPKLFVECKNYSRKIANPELDQIAGRFSDRRGRVGLIVCRQVDDKDLFLQRCRDTADDGNGFIIALDDGDLRSLVEGRKQSGTSFPLLRDRFDALTL
jgi:hypothetical protein